MSSSNSDFNIAKNIRIIEWLKAELLAGISSLYKAMIKNNEDLILDSLAHIIMGCYFLGKRLGLSYAKIEARLDERIKAAPLQEHEIEEWYGDVSNLQQHFKERNRD
jgi:hypothetical protein